MVIIKKYEGLAETSTVPVSFPVSSTIQAEWTSTQPVTISTTSTYPVTFKIASASVTTSTAFNVTTTAATLVAANSDRIFLGIRNLGSNVVLLRHGAPPSTTAYDLYLNTDDYYEINQMNLFTGNIQIIASTLTSTVTVIEV